MKVESAAFLDQADVMLARAELMLSVGLNEDTAREAYLACFHAAQAYIFERTGNVSKTHRGVQTEFFRLSKDDVRADYGIGPDAVTSAQAATDAITTAKRFVSHFGGLVDPGGNSGVSPPLEPDAS
jgi:uncharacterized protein (UPF0332 family)